jgi:hypothetical protein
VAVGHDLGVGPPLDRRLPRRGRRGRVLAAGRRPRPHLPRRRGRVTDEQTGGTWDQFGRAVVGPLAGTRLAQATAMDSFWFDWAAFHPDTAIWGGR